MVLTISVDRCLMITHGNVYGKYITMKILYGFVSILLIFNFTWASWKANTGGFPMCWGKGKSEQYWNFAMIIFHVVFVLLTIGLYTYLLYNVRRKSKRLKNCRHGNINYNNHLLRTIIYIFICLLITFIPHTISVYLNIASIEITTIQDRNKVYWEIFSLYSNSYLNAIIILINMKSHLKKNKTTNLASDQNGTESATRSRTTEE